MKKFLSITILGLLNISLLANNISNDNVVKNESDISLSKELEKVEETREEVKKEKLEEAKERAIINISERIETLEKAKNCIKESESKEDLEDCRPNKKDKENK